MKKNFTTSELPHIWAHQKQQQGKAGNFYFDGKTIYSYGGHFPIATHLDDGNTVAFTTRTYSVTTSGHINAARGAVSHKTLLYCSNPKSASEGYHDNNIREFIQAIHHKLNEITPRTRKPEIMKSAALHQLELLNKYLTYFKIKKSKEIKDAEKLCSSNDVVEQIKQLKLKKERAQKKETARQIKDWKEYGKTRYINNSVETYLRTNGEIVETSKGITISIPRAKMYYNWVVSTGNCNGCNFEMEHYKVNKLTKTHLVVGCHNIPLTEIKEIAKRLKF